MNVADTEGNGRGSRRAGRPDPSGQGKHESVGALPLTVGSLFSGIGGFDLGLERAGMQTLWFCEQDPFCRRVLARHWPGVPCYPDVRALVADTDRESLRVRAGGMDATAGALEGGEAQRERVRSDAGNGSTGGGSVPVPVSYVGADGVAHVEVAHVDVLCGGFPCQDISLAGRGAGLAGERSGLWREFARLIGDLRPRYVLVENVPALTSRGLDVVLGDLAACGFDAEWDHLSAAQFGAPHRRDRIWLVAYPDGQRCEPRSRWDESLRESLRSGEPADLADFARHGAEEQAPAGTVGQRARASGERSGACLADADRAAGNGTRPAGEALPRPGEVERPGRRGGGNGREGIAESDLGGMAARVSPWLDEPDVGRVAVGVPQRVDRLRALGNSLVPQIAEWIGCRIVEWERLMNHPRGERQR